MLLSFKNTLPCCQHTDVYQTKYWKNFSNLSSLTKPHVMTIIASLMRHKLLTTFGIGTITTVTWYKTRSEWSPDIAPTNFTNSIARNPNISQSIQKLPSREELLKKLTDKSTIFDVLIIGGGATGTGCALDAQSRGLNVALVEQNDFAGGTSSKSTKLAHGGVRYLEKAFTEFSKDQLNLVIEALNERAHLLNTAPHLSKVLPIIIPIYNYWQVPYYYLGCKFYDLFAGNQNLRKSFVLSKNQMNHIAPMLNQTNLKLGLVYHDGIFNDSRFCLSLAMTAINQGATIINYIQVIQLLKDPSTGKLLGAKLKDRETGQIFDVKAKTIVNATGPFSDAILQMDNNKDGLPDKINSIPSTTMATINISDEQPTIAVKNPKMVVPSAGVHIILPSYYCPKNMGLLDANTNDGRVMFFLPWMGKVIAGTTDIPLKQVPSDPTPTESDIQDILKELQHYIKFPVKREDVLSAWAGIRPLVKDPRLNTDQVDIPSHEDATQGLVRSHFLFTSSNGLITIAGGKWTTFREMAEETIDEVIKVGKFNNVQGLKPCHTKNIKLIGSQNWDLNYEAFLQQTYHISPTMAEYLSNSYGDHSPVICELFKTDPQNKLPLTMAGNNECDSNAFDYPYTIGELKYSIHNEYTRTPLDFLLRRTRFTFVDANESLKALEGTVNVMAKELNWDSTKKNYEFERAKNYIHTFGI